jgi:hypothetical protein
MLEDFGLIVLRRREGVERDGHDVAIVMRRAHHDRCDRKTLEHPARAGPRIVRAALTAAPAAVALSGLRGEALSRPVAPVLLLGHNALGVDDDVELLHWACSFSRRRGIAPSWW